MPNGGHWHTQRADAGKRGKRRADSWPARARRLARGAVKLARKHTRQQNPPTRWFVAADGTKHTPNA